jgi:hypothetical protein
MRRPRDPSHARASKTSSRAPHCPTHETKAARLRERSKACPTMVFLVFYHSPFFLSLVYFNPMATGFRLVPGPKDLQILQHAPNPSIPSRKEIYGMGKRIRQIIPPSNRTERMDFRQQRYWSKINFPIFSNAHKNDGNLR